ncbi:cupin domain-containing protein [Streptomyces sp. NBC_01361]|uniref:cupin domain-containing protein n=1 Tax=Streptomyces sp. NBC_01361 TaxID=2903838 RepID=UPI002E3049B1|nr:cupin domain-containing protein [Streptomyces sp. NBC_01361]
MTEVSIAECLGGEQFAAQVLHRDFSHVKAALSPSAVAGLVGFDDLNDLLALHRLEAPRLRLSQGGQILPVHRYATREVTRRRTVWERVHPAELHERLAQGASLVIDAIDELHGPVGLLAEQIEAWLHTACQVNAYASWTAEQGFGTHWDDHDVIVVQVEGAKRWRIYGPTRVHPMHVDVIEPEEPQGEPLAELVMEPGDVLYLPRGWWHEVTADQGVPSLHLTCGLTPRTGADLMSWLGEKLRAHDALRADLPVHADPREQAEYAEHLAKLVRAELERPGLISEYVRARDGDALGRMRPSLPFVSEVPADAELLVRMTSARARIEPGAVGDGVTLRAAGGSWDLAAAARPMLELLLATIGGTPVRLGDLAAAAGASVEDVAALVGEFVAGQAVTVAAGESR